MTLFAVTPTRATRSKASPSPTFGTVPWSCDVRERSSRGSRPQSWSRTLAAPIHVDEGANVGYAPDSARNGRLPSDRIYVDHSLSASRWCAALWSRSRRTIAWVATASPSPTPNPDATRFTLDTTLPASFNVTSADAALGNRFAEDVFAAGGVASVFGVNDFVTVTRQPGADWGPIVAAVQAAAEAHL